MGQDDPDGLPGRFPRLLPPELDRVLLNLDLPEARERLIEGTLWVVSELAAARRAPELSQEDLFQEGTAGVLKVVHGLDPRQPLAGEAFIASARQAAETSIDAFIAGDREARREDQRWAEDAEAVFLAEAELRAQAGVEPSDVELAAHLSWDPERVHQLRRAVADARSRHDLELVDILGEIADDD